MLDIDPHRPLELDPPAVPANCVCRLLNTHSRVMEWEVEVIGMKFPFKGRKKVYVVPAIHEQMAADQAMKKFSREMCGPGARP